MFVSLSGVPLPAEDTILQVQRGVKESIFGGEGAGDPTADPKEMVCLLHWEHAEITYREVFHDLYASGVIDARLGSGSAFMASANLGITYEGFADSQQHIDLVLSPAPRVAAPVVLDILNPCSILFYSSQYVKVTANTRFTKPLPSA